MHLHQRIVHLFKDTIQVKERNYENNKIHHLKNFSVYLIREIIFHLSSLNKKLDVFQMSNKILRMRFISFKDAANQPFTDILLYIKKLKHSLTSGKILIDFEMNKSF